MGLTGIVFLLLFTAGLGAAFVRGPIWGLWTYMMVFYLHPPSRWWGVGLPDIRWSLAAAMVTLLALLVHRNKIAASDTAARPAFFKISFAWYFLFYVAWMWIQTPFVLSTVHMDGVVLFTKYFLLIYLIYEIVRTDAQIRDTLLVHIAGCMFLGWVAYETGTGSSRLEGVGGPGIDDSNSMSMQFSTAVLAGAALMLREKLPRMTAIMIAMPLILNGMVLGNSRGAFVALVGAGIVLWWLKPSAIRGRFYLFGGLAVFLFMTVAHEKVWDRLLTLNAVTDEQEELDNSAMSRIAIMNAQFRMFKDYPLGAGHKGTAYLSPSYIETKWLTRKKGDPKAKAARSSHNTFFSVMVDHGIVGVVLLCLIVLWVVRSMRQCRRAFKGDPKRILLLCAVVGALTAVSIAGLFAPYLKAEINYWLLGLLMSVLALRPESVPAEATEPDARRSEARPLHNRGGRFRPREPRVTDPPGRIVGRR